MVLGIEEGGVSSCRAVVAFIGCVHGLLPFSCPLKREELRQNDVLGRWGRGKKASKNTAYIQYIHNESWRSGNQGQDKREKREGRFYFCCIYCKYIHYYLCMLHKKSLLSKSSLKLMRVRH